MPIVMLSALAEEPDRVLGLELGADDYVTKPFSPRALSLRVRSLLRRVQPPAPAVPSVVRDGALVVDVPAHVASVAGRELPLTAREFDLLAFLLANPHRAHTRTELLEQVWG